MITYLFYRYLPIEKFTCDESNQIKPNQTKSNQINNLI